MNSKKPTSKTMYVIQRKSDGLFYKNPGGTKKYRLFSQRKGECWTDNLLEVVSLFQTKSSPKSSIVWVSRKLVSSGRICTCGNDDRRKYYVDDKYLTQNSSCDDRHGRCVSMMYVKIIDEKDFPYRILPVKVKVELEKGK